MANFLAVELARTGKFEASTGPVTLTEADFDHLVEAAKGLKGKIDIPVKLGHEDTQDLLEKSGLPAAGWVENVRRVGDRLVADIMNVPAAVEVLIRNGALRKRSIEAVRNVTLAGTKWKFALVGLALLGSELPAVDSLEDIAALYASGQVAQAGSLPGSNDEAQIVVVVMAGSLPSLSEVEVLIEELRSVIGKIGATTAGRRGAPKLRQLLSVAVDELRLTGAFVRAGAATTTEEEQDMDYAKYRTMLKLPETATDEEVLAALDAKLAANQEGTTEGTPAQATPNPADPVAAQLAKMSADLTSATTQLAQMQSAAQETEVTRQVDDAIKARRFMPASRESLIKLAMHDSTAFGELIKTTPQNAVLAPERGTASGESVPSELEPTAAEMKIAASMGLTRETLIKSKARTAGVEYTPTPATK